MTKTKRRENLRFLFFGRNCPLETPTYLAELNECEQDGYFAHDCFKNVYASAVIIN